jgi:hypothetical protein
VLGDLWARLMRRRGEATVAHETEREHMSPAERRVTGESVDDIQADEFVKGRLGGIDPERLLGEDKPPPG